MDSFPGETFIQPFRPYNDHILSITEATTPDPYVILHKGTYYMTFTRGDRIEVWSADSLFNFEKRAKNTILWRPPPNTAYSADLWAPELHALHGRWYVYFAADDPAHGNQSHKMFVLSGPPSTSSPLDPSSWKFEGRVGGLPDNQWAIDGTVISLNEKNYFVYSGWPIGLTEDSPVQELFIAQMKSPISCTTDTAPVRISTPQEPWEFSGRSGINEGPQWLASPTFGEAGKWQGLVYSCAGSWTHEYKMNVLQYIGGDPLKASSWKKSRTPLLKASGDDTPPYGPGHGNFVYVDGMTAGPEVWGVFHATDGKTGWDGRRARIMRVGWTKLGPYMGNGECGTCDSDVGRFLGREDAKEESGRNQDEEKGTKGVILPAEGFNH